MSSSVKKLIVRLWIYIACFMFMFFYLWICELGYGIPCVFYEVFHMKCPGCGATRSFIALVSGELKAAIEFHAIFALALYPISAILILQDCIVASYRLFFKKDSISILEFIWQHKNKFSERIGNQK